MTATSAPALRYTELLCCLDCLVSFFFFFFFFSLFVNSSTHYHLICSLCFNISALVLLLPWCYTSISLARRHVPHRWYPAVCRSGTVPAINASNVHTIDLIKYLHPHLQRIRHWPDRSNEYCLWGVHDNLPQREHNSLRPHH